MPKVAVTAVVAVGRSQSHCRCCYNFSNSSNNTFACWRAIIPLPPSWRGENEEQKCSEERRRKEEERDKVTHLAKEEKDTGGKKPQRKKMGAEAEQKEQQQHNNNSNYTHQQQQHLSRVDSQSCPSSQQREKSFPLPDADAEDAYLRVPVQLEAPLSTVVDREGRTVGSFF